MLFVGGGAEPMVQSVPPSIKGDGEDTPNGDVEDAGESGDVLGCPDVKAGGVLLVSPVAAGAGVAPPKRSAEYDAGFEAGVAARPPGKNGELTNGNGLIEGARVAGERFDALEVNKLPPNKIGVVRSGAKAGAGSSGSFWGMTGFSGALLGVVGATE